MHPQQTKDSFLPFIPREDLGGSCSSRPFLRSIGALPAPGKAATRAFWRGSNGC